MRVLFALTIYHYARELHPVAAYLRARGHEVHALVGWSGETAEAYAERCRREGIVVHVSPPELRYSDPWDRADDAAEARPPAPPVGRVGLLRRRLGIATYRLGVLAGLWRSAKAKRAAGGDLIRLVRPDVVFSSSYRGPGSLDEGVGEAAKRAGIPYACIPQSAYTGERNAIHSRMRHLRSGMLTGGLDADSGLVNRAVARLFPRWTRPIEGQRLFSHEPLALLGARLAGFGVANPWQHPSELYDVCFVESDFARRLLLDSGYTPEKIVVSGKPVLDPVIAALDDPRHAGALRRAIGIRTEEPFLLLNVEPAYEHEYATKEEHWARTREVFDVVRASGLEVVTSLHPFCRPDDYRELIAEFGFHLADEHKIAELYPYARACVSFPCSTNLLSLEFGTPLVVYDFYGMTGSTDPGSEDFHLPGARYAYGRDELERRLGEALAEARTPPERPQRPPAREVIARELAARFGLRVDGSG